MNKKIIQRISLLILLFVLPIAYPVTDIHAQDVRVTIRMEKVRMEQVMNEIERQTKYLFGSAENVDVKRIVTVQVVNRPLQEALDAMLRGTNVSYTVQGSNIVLKNGRSEAEAKKPAVISGVVRDAAGNPVVGAAVVVKGTTIGISTDSEGRFSLQVPPPASQAVLEINYLGYAPADVRVGSATRFDITLKEDSQQISDVLVVGYTPMRKSDFTGSIASVKASELTTTTPTMAQALAGKVAGVEVRQADGAPGEGVQIRVRGVNSLSAGSDPLYVVDGYPASEDVYINPGDIESIDILKDAASAAIYGSRGASGVVLITTKRGKEGERAKIKCYGCNDVLEGVAIMKMEKVDVSITGNSTNPTRFQHPVAGTYKKWCWENGVKYFSVASGGGTDNMAAGPASYGLTDTMGRMHGDAQFAGSSSVPAHVEMMGLIGMGNNPMVGATVACAVAAYQAMNK